MGDVTSPAGKRPIPTWGWAASLVLVAGSVVGIVWATHRPSVGPTIKAPFGNTSISPPVTTTTRPHHRGVLLKEREQKRALRAKLAVDRPLRESRDPRHFVEGHPLTASVGTDPQPRVEEQRASK